MVNKSEPSSEIRVDKWLWAVRVFKTRSQSAEACRKGRVTIGDVAVKPSRVVRPGDIISVRKPPSVFSYRVKDTVEKRQSAKSTCLYMEDLTPAEEIEKLKLKNTIVFAQRERGSGRPTKRERRVIDRIKGVD